MNFFTKTRFLIAVIIILSAIIVAMFITMGYNRYRNTHRNSRDIENREVRQMRNAKEREERGRFMAKQLQLTPEQMRDFNEIREKFHDDFEELLDESRKISRDIMEEITSEKPDTNELNALAEKFGASQKAQKQMMINHLLEIRSKCNPSQQANFKKVLKRIENQGRMYRERRQNTE